MDEVIRPSKYFKGQLRVPGDKSISHRALVFAALAHGKSEIVNYLNGQDVQATMKCLEQLGVRIEQYPNKLIVHGLGGREFLSPHHILDCQNSGTTIRLLMGMLAGKINHKVELTGDESLRKRPMKRVAFPLIQMGAKLELSQDQFAPLTICGKKLKAIDYELPVASAQVKSALILAALFADGETRLTGKIQSRDHTERMLPLFGGKLSVSDECIKIVGGQKLVATNLVVPGDISTAAFWIVAATLVENGQVTIENVSLNPTRMGLIHVMKRMGANIETHIESNIGEPFGVIKVKHAKLKGIKISPDEIPSLVDEIPLIAILATQAQGETYVSGADELKHKESNRILAIEKNLKRMGVKVEILDDGFKIEGRQKLIGTRIETFQDHRIAMAFSIAGLIAEGNTVIEKSECVAVSYPDFYQNLASLILPKAKLIGHPVTQSLSPAIFYFFSMLTKRSIIYQKEDIDVEQLDSFMKTTKDLAGFNITLPLKEKVIDYVDEISHEAKIIGAVNVVKVENERLMGFNSDVIGIEKTLKHEKINNVLIIGAGGGARSAIYACLKLKASRICIYNPRSNRGEIIQKEFSSLFHQCDIKNITVEQLDQTEFNLVINATPVGMGEDSLEAQNFFNIISKIKKSQDALAFDLIYYPAKTAFLTKAEISGLRIINGLPMLIDQAIETWRLWLGDISISIEQRRLMESFLNNILKLRRIDRPIVLTGFMGVGKTTIAKKMAELLGQNFIDIDLAIQNDRNQTVDEIFRNHGEAFFRELEKNKIAEVLESSKSIIALGGGSLLDKATLDLVVRKGHLVYLACELEEIFERQKASLINRPLLNLNEKDNWQKNAQEQLKLRIVGYEKAPIKITTDQLSTFEVLLAVLSALGKDHE